MNIKAQQYLIVTASYWSFTLTDGALRMLVVLYFHSLSYSPFEIASLFIMYELFGIITNLFGGWLANLKGLNTTLKTGLLLQIVALCMLLLPPSLLVISYVMLAQALSGVAKDLSKLSAKSSIKNLVPDEQQGQLYKWVALLTGSKNTLKGVGFFLGAALFSTLDFQGAISAMIIFLSTALFFSHYCLHKDKSSKTFKPKFSSIFSKSDRINRLSAARFFLFGSRDIWFVIALPVYLQSHLNWQHIEVGTFMACWVITYGFVQTLSPFITRLTDIPKGMTNNTPPNGKSTIFWILPLIFITAFLAYIETQMQLSSAAIVIGLILFGVFFAITSSLHSYLIVAYADQDNVSLDVGFYYMANSAGRLIGTLLSGLLFQQYGLAACLTASSFFLIFTALITIRLPQTH